MNARTYNYKNARESKTIRRMLARTGNRCPECNISFHDRNYHVDHIIPISRGGADTPGNWQILCGRCNSKKHAFYMTEWKARRGDIPRSVNMQFLQRARDSRLRCAAALAEKRESDAARAAAEEERDAVIARAECIAQDLVADAERQRDEAIQSAIESHRDLVYAQTQVALLNKDRSAGTEAYKRGLDDGIAIVKKRRKEDIAAAVKQSADAVRDWQRAYDCGAADARRGTAPRSKRKRGWFGRGR